MNRKDLYNMILTIEGDKNIEKGYSVVESKDFSRIIENPSMGYINGIKFLLKSPKNTNSYTGHYFSSIDTKSFSLYRNIFLTKLYKKLRLIGVVDDKIPKTLNAMYIKIIKAISSYFINSIKNFKIKSIDIQFNKNKNSFSIELAKNGPYFDFILYELKEHPLKKYVDLRGFASKVYEDGSVFIENITYESTASGWYSLYDEIKRFEAVLFLNYKILKDIDDKIEFELNLSQRIKNGAYINS